MEPSPELVAEISVLAGDSSASCRSGGKNRGIKSRWLLDLSFMAALACLGLLLPWDRLSGLSATFHRPRVEPTFVNLAPVHRAARWFALTWLPMLVWNFSGRNGPSATASRHEG